MNTCKRCKGNGRIEMLEHCPKCFGNGYVKPHPEHACAFNDGRQNCKCYAEGYDSARKKTLEEVAAYSPAGQVIADHLSSLLPKAPDGSTM